VSPRSLRWYADPMIITVTANPALDFTYEMPELILGEVNRAANAQIDAGGKGINISRALLAHNVPTVAIYPASGGKGKQLTLWLKETGVPVKPVEVIGDTRANVTIVDADGVTTKINAPGTPLVAADKEALIRIIKDTIIQEAIDWQQSEYMKMPGDIGNDPPIVVLAGSLSAGTDPDLYAELAKAATSFGAQVALDSSGEPFARAIRAGGLLVVKPNLEELAEFAGRVMDTVGDVVIAAREILAYGNHMVLVTLGEDGAILVTPETWIWAGGDPLVPRSTVGAGDMTLTGFLVGLQSHPELLVGPLRAGVAWGRAAVLQPGTGIPLAKDISVQGVSFVVQPDFGKMLHQIGHRSKTN